ncbi:polyol transporter 2 [Dorcoceras hygrometricum]|uniref:Polyol transporter 2 n=1 Tax=Dorcoceras hygrometricum TaxID=472368 RepID=A0A2Z7D4D3_9LAMI|nr:polyol transporter 2 [Dorcoceras hygrometricum]
MRSVVANHGPGSSPSIGYPRIKASSESSTTKHRLLHASGPHPIPPPNDPKTNQYNQDLGLIHSTNGNHLESLNDGSSIDHQVTIHLHAQNITMFPTNETWPPPFLSSIAAARRAPPPPPPVFAGKFVSGQFDEENPFVLISSVLLVQADEGVSFLVVDRIGDIYRSLPRRADVIVTTVGARYKCQQDVATGTSFWKDFTREKPSDGFRPPADGRYDDVSGATSFC